MMTTAEGMNFQVPETMKGSNPGSNFMVFAKNNDLKIGIRPLVGVTRIDKVIWFALGFRLRVEKSGPNGSLKFVKEAFGIEGFDNKETHASVVGGIPLISMPCSPDQAYQVWQEGMVTHRMVEQIVKQCEDAGATLTVTPDQMVEYLNLVYDEAIPNNKPTVAESFDVKFGLVFK